MLNSRQLNTVGFALIFFALVASFVIEYAGYEPCVLCLVQRYCLVAVGALFLIALVRYKRVLWQKCFWTASFVPTLIGLAAVGRQLYLQHFPVGEDAQCLPGARFFWEMGSYLKALKALFAGAQECGEVSTTFFGLSFAAWSGLFLLAVLALTLMLFQSKRQS